MKPVDDLQRSICASIQASIAAKEQLLRDEDLLLTMATVSHVVVQAMEMGNKAIFFGNGGSAADAQHLAAEFVGRFNFNRPPLPAMALTANTSSLTAIGNDYGFELVFSRQIEALGYAGDVAFGISTSGNSRNVICGLAAARKRGMHTVALTGRSGGSIKDAADFCIKVSAEETPRIQECHILIGHIIAEIVEHKIFHEQSSLSRP